MSEKMILGAQLYTVRDYMKNEEDFARTMERIAKIGYKYVQVAFSTVGLLLAFTARGRIRA